MSRRAIITHLTRSALRDDAALQISTLVEGAIDRRGRALVVLTGGSTVGPIYKRLAAGIGDRRVAWDRVEFFWSDERCVDIEHEDSNYDLASRTLLEPLGIDAERVHRWRAEEEDRQRAASAYESEIFEILGEGAPLFDVVILGMGADAHVASLFPNHPLIEESDRWTGWVDATAFAVPEPAVDRLTLTPRALRSARETLIVAAGKRKASAVHHALGEEYDPMRWPAQLVHAPEARVTWLLDEAAASKTDFDA